MKAPFRKGKYDGDSSRPPPNSRQREVGVDETFPSLLSEPDQMELVAKGEHMAERMLTLREVSDYLNVNPATVRTAGEIRPVTRYQGWTGYALRSARRR